MAYAEEWLLTGLPSQGGRHGPTAADVLIDTIHDRGMDTIFGLPGDGINGIWRPYASDRTRSASSGYATKRHCGRILNEAFSAPGR